MTAPEYLTAPALDGLPHGFFTRRGGVSAPGRFGTLNCSLSGRDEIAAVRANRAAAAAALGAAPEALRGLHQVHGVAVVEAVDPPWPETARPHADAAVSRTPGVLLGIVTADCAPVLFADRAAGVIGAAHAGWRGAVSGKLEATVAAMEALGASRARIAAAIGPCIHQPSYEVGPDLRDAVLARDAADARFFAPGLHRADRWQFDLPGYCAARLTALDLAAVVPSPADTLAEPDRFFSHRRATLAGDTPVGHQLSAIGLPAR
jgi:YfiH family protein